MKKLSKSSQQLQDAWFTTETKLREKGFLRIAGVDEAGRGPLAGPVAAAAVILPPFCRIEGLNDSKKLSSARRERLAQEIRCQALACAVAVVSARVIDQIGILPATFRAMALAIGNLGIQPDYLFIDGNLPLPQYKGTQETLVGGDGLAAPVAAASILAKVTRDRLMVRFGQIFPGYGFEKHKGYGTVAHREAIILRGPTLIHRTSFLHIDKWEEE
ncbi:ribonuclease HII [Heliobacillus mobilis]|uniref:Ribonuclease HII n=1 Tax=Heliobacterium mobile TaxID=28064 RepID=A0A6I3SGC7_HELMO|nr:ribonuclease HII [Heliobacterium mobile]